MSSKLKAKLKYKSDNFMSKGMPALLAMLIIVSLLFLALFAVLIILIAKKFNFPNQSSHPFWCVFTHMLDPGTVTTDESTNGIYIFIMIFITIFGLIINSILIGTITNAIDTKLSSLKSGKSKIIEKNHTVIMGLNDSSLMIINELILANMNLKKSCIVVVDNKDNADMSEKIQYRFNNQKNTKIICRTGNPLEEHVLDVCSIETAKSIIINYNNDFYTLKQLLSISKYAESLKKDVNFHVVCLIKEEKNLEPAKFIGKGFADVIYIEDMLARIIAHSCRYPGLSKVFSDIFTFDDNEIYFEKNEKLNGMNFGNILYMFNNSVVLGLVKDGIPRLNPPIDTVYDYEKDKIIILSQDDCSAKINSSLPEISTKNIIKSEEIGKITNENRKLLIINRNELLFDILTEFDKYVGPESVATLIDNSCDFTDLEIPDFKNITFKIKEVNFYKRQNIAELLIKGGYDTVLLLCDLDKNNDEADSNILINLANLRAVIEEYGLKINIISEMRSVENQKLLYNESISDFIVGANITSLIMSQISENRNLLPIFMELLDERGSEFYMRPISYYVRIGIPVNAYQLQHVAEKKREIIIGYKRYENNQYKLYINPDKNEKLIFSEDDYAIVVAIS